MNWFDKILQTRVAEVIIVILFIICLAFIPISAINQTKQAQEQHAVQASQYPYQIYEVTYKGHDYIVFDGLENNIQGAPSGLSSGVVHSPDCCKCTGNYANERDN